MSENPCIATIARILGSTEPSGALATILFEHYNALSMDSERRAFVVALIGELLVKHALLTRRPATLPNLLAPSPCQTFPKVCP
jgi:hypothetical protein